MKLLSTFALAATIALTGCQSTNAILENQPIELFNGSDLTNWTIESNGKFHVSNGVIKLNRGTGWLRSNDKFSDYVLTIEFRFMEEGANSGIFIRTQGTMHEDEKGYPNNGYQVQVMDTLEGNALGKLIPYGAPEFQHTFDLEALKRAYKPHGQWHTYQITAQGETFSIVLNGEVVSTATNIKNLDGHIGIQGEFGLLEFRKIEIIEL
ncbi:3-keto-disaccharide hydrolase [Echinimonas agarilytica]|uniref:DUF1080 domain-containing protein n=1 Tax=Echinimonas agarilytica TaxID=1215918 RepID=A0AA41W7K4_9GAMM|nr:DUF1080 domain-containing protein [Echinimonas agarilytica]MCM2680712.1 DUF1080 domain-containing protein [Echinimonas agarilytica]